MVLDDVEILAERLADAYRDGPVGPVRGAIADADGAYAVQDRNTVRWLAQGRRLVGRKIGLTSAAVQRQFGVDQPDYGMLFADMAHASGAPIAFGDFLQPRIEGEIAFEMRSRLDRPDATAGDVLAAVEAVLPAFEIVDSRIAGWDIGFLDTVADNASSGAFVLGSRRVRPAAVDLELCGMVIEHRGEPVSTGAGLACLGNPLHAAVWLVRKMAQVGRPVEAGDIILTGALGPMVPVTGPGAYELRISGLGATRAVFV